MPIASPDVWTRQLTVAEDAALGIGAGRHSFHLMHTGGMQTCVDHPGWDSSWPVPTEHDIDDLVEQGLVRLDAPIGGKDRSFTLTTQGRLHGMRAREARSAAAQSPPASLEWTALEPVLEAAITVYEQAGLPEGGISLAQVPMPADSPREAGSELVRAGLLIDCDVEGGGTSGVDQISGPTFVRPSTQALQLKRGWPQGAAAAAINQLAEAMLSEADQAEDDSERTRLQKTAAWLRQAGTAIVTGVGTQLAQQEASHLLH